MRLFDQWTLEAIRSEGASMSWFEEHRFDWIPQIIGAMDQIMKGHTVVLVTDHERRWFGNYILETINKKFKERPLIPIVSLDALYSHLDVHGDVKEMDVLGDMLDISFKSDYFVWYIGRGGNEQRADFAKRSDNALMWMMDENYPNALMLKSYDSHIDIKLLQLYRLFDRTLAAVLFGEIDVHA